MLVGAPPWGRAAGALVALAALACLQACTPAAKPVTALRSVDGDPTLLIVSCSDFQVDEVSVYEDKGDAGQGAVWRIRGAGGRVPDRLRLLEAPAGWSVADKSLGAFSQGTEYAVSAYDEDARPAVSIHFTLGDLAALDRDEVLVGKSASRRAAVSESEFRKKAKRSC